MKNERWDLPSLVGALAACDAALAAGVSVEVPEGVGHAAVVTLDSTPDLKIVMGVDGGEIQVSALVERVENVGNRAEFNERLLESGKLLDLSAFGITTLDGVKWYEVFGQLSSRSSLEVVLEEIVALRKNAVEALELVVEWEAGAAVRAQAN